MTLPVTYYNEQKQKYFGQLAVVGKKIERVAMSRLWLVLGTIACGIYLYNSTIAYHWWMGIIPVVIFLFLVKLSLNLKEEQDGVKLHISIIDNELQSLEGNFSAFNSGVSFVDSLHPYSYDLDIFGIHSVYQMLCRTVTIGGANLLAKHLKLLTQSKEQILERQSVIKELSSFPDLLQQFRVEGMKVKEEAGDQSRLSEWLLSENSFLEDRLIRIAVIAMPVIAALFIVYSFIIGSMFPGLVVVIAINWTLIGRYAKKIKSVGKQVGNTAQLIEKYERLMTQLASGNFKNGWLKGAAENAASSLAQISRFRKLVKLFDSRSNNMVGPLMNMFFLFDFISLLRLEAWKKQYHQLLLNTIDSIVQADVYVSCAVYAFNHPDSIYPTFDGQAKIVEADSLVHPLLAPGHAIGNDFSLGKQEQFYLLTGANMTGKSTFIRTIGVSLVCGQLGLPLPAKRLVLPLVDLYTSMRVTDSVQDDISYFKAELNRIQSIMTHVKAATQPYLVLLDEPLRGTNSTDKQEGTRAIVENLLQCHSIGIVATHDTVLCDMERHFPGLVSNYHFESKVETVGLSFDFKLKPGGSTSNNATILMKQMGILK